MEKTIAPNSKVIFQIYTLTPSPWSTTSNNYNYTGCPIKDVPILFLLLFFSFEDLRANFLHAGRKCSQASKSIKRAKSQMYYKKYLLSLHAKLKNLN